MKIIEKRLDEIKPYEKNPRRNDAAVEYVAESIRNFGWKQPIVIDKDGVIIAGHTRYKAAQSMGLEKVPCLIADDLTPEQVKAYRLADNKVGEIAEWDNDQLFAELSELADFDLDMSMFSFDVDLTLFEAENEKESGNESKKHFWGDVETETTEEYESFVEKFKPKLTTDDVYTPDNIYSALLSWAVSHYSLGKRKTCRPFYPGGDYQSYNYPENCVVVDNPPFSILSEICAWYDKRGIDYLLFAPSLTLFSTNSGKCKYLPIGLDILYSNGASIATSFVTNMGNWRIEVCPDLFEALREPNEENKAAITKKLPNYEYPTCLCNASINKLAKYGQPLKISVNDAAFIRGLDAQREHEKTIYGGGFLLSKKAAAEKAAAEKAAEKEAEKQRNEKRVWGLSSRELKIIETLGDKEK